MKIISRFILALFMMLSLVGCSNKIDNVNKNTTNSKLEFFTNKDITFSWDFEDLVNIFQKKQDNFLEGKSFECKVKKNTLIENSEIYEEMMYEDCEDYRSCVESGDMRDDLMKDDLMGDYLTTIDKVMREKCIDYTKCNKDNYRKHSVFENCFQGWKGLFWLKYTKSDNMDIYYLDWEFEAYAPSTTYNENCNIIRNWKNIKNDCSVVDHIKVFQGYKKHHPEDKIDEHSYVGSFPSILKKYFIKDIFLFLIKYNTEIFSKSFGNYGDISYKWLYKNELHLYKIKNNTYSKLEFGLYGNESLFSWCNFSDLEEKSVSYFPYIIFKDDEYFYIEVLGVQYTLPNQQEMIEKYKDVYHIKEWYWFPDWKVKKSDFNINPNICYSKVKINRNDLSLNFIQMNKITVRK